MGTVSPLTTHDVAISGSTGAVLDSSPLIGQTRPLDGHLLDDLDGLGLDEDHRDGDDHREDRPHEARRWPLRRSRRGPGPPDPLAA